MSNRIYFLDNLRAFVIILVIVLHGSMTYMAYAPPWWYVVDSQSSLFFTALVLLIDVPIMLVMFFVAGYFAYPSLTKRGPVEFIKDKAIRIGLPWVLGVIFLAPLSAYMIYVSRDVPVGYLQFWTNDFWGEMYQQSVYWFLGILFLWFIILAGIYAVSDRFRQLTQQVNRPGWGVFVLFGGLMTVGFLAMNQFYSLDTWSHFYYIFMFQPLRLPLYAGYFILGLFAYKNGWFTTAGTDYQYKPRLWLWSLIFVVSGLLYLGYRFTIPGPAQATLLLQAGNALLFNTVCLSGLMAGVALFQRQVDVASFFWRSQAVSSYGIYYVHPLILYPLAYAFLSLSFSVFLKALVLIVLAALLSWAVSALVLRRAPLLRQAF